MPDEPTKLYLVHTMTADEQNKLVRQWRVKHGDEVAAYAWADGINSGRCRDIVSCRTLTKPDSTVPMEPEPWPAEPAELSAADMRWLVRLVTWPRILHPLLRLAYRIAHWRK